MTEEFIREFFDQSEWLSQGQYGGKRIEHAEKAFWAATAAASVSIKVLDAAYANDDLALTLMGTELYNDVMRGRIGQEWDEERDAIAEQTAVDFSDKWPRLREHLLELQLISWVSAAENYVKAVLLEFSSTHTSDDPFSSDERQWNGVDEGYRKAVKKKQSTSAAWVALCIESSISDIVKINLRQWEASGDAKAIDEVTKIRNEIVHKGGLVVKPHQMARYTRAFAGFTVCIDPTF